ncbi:5,10-methylenetetrahydrofolate reductase (NAD(P)) [Anseongella ginsenosidimutans]|uniref:Methylenetetrahydrofolate reductase n=1 Tax=Anseongella ginsenosidimutans TaxID=496056 RepID=A0A4R3KQH9_9SPHI|nr:methylenetetrahydrofolate reductase [NAD(P)H] [Anseongella ginsenosidimutans]QEC52220.1 methylenetetrahydrofolate reductase [NAD(P)H] [Anseongella ginsenosidimutans]TCS86770.1 5,10-methylenetetrahydrofolate reductase (NAD(P)) [Anseongella ginsenosidimutans]
MKVTDHLKNAKKTLFTIEILPPVKGKSIQSIYDAIDPLMEFKPAFIDVTYLREEFIYKKRENGLLEKVAYRKRPSTISICAAIMNKYKVDAVPHLICGGFSKEDTENALIDLNFLGIENVLALRGDGDKVTGEFVPEPKGHAYGCELVEQIVCMNKGKYLDDELLNAHPSDFCIGVAGYPEKHFEAPNLKTDLRYLKQKVDKGADYIVTQMFFDNKKYFEFVKACRDFGINVPIIPGLKPITTLKQLSTLPKVFYIDIPEELSEEVINCKTNADVCQVGTEWMIAQCKELIDYGVPCLHFYTMGRSEPTRQIAEALF